ncbi:MAG: MFS transporter [Leptolyngbyaceae cyanobacterium]
MNHQQQTTSNRDPGRWLMLAACITAVLMAAIDGGILNLIVPAIQQEFDVSQATISLMTSISTLMLAAFILGSGTLGDLYGRRRFILIGTGGVVAAAVLSMLAPTATSLIGIRALDGIFQALVNPLALAILTVTFDNEERPKALGIYGESVSDSVSDYDRNCDRGSCLALIVLVGEPYPIFWVITRAHGAVWRGLQHCQCAAHECPVELCPTSPGGYGFCHQ